MKVKEEFWIKVRVIVFVYTFGVFLISVYGILRLFRRIKIEGSENIPKKLDKGLLITPNHPSLIEPVLVSLIFWKHFLFHPLKGVPWNAPDKKNYGRWYWFWIQPRMIEINRKNKREITGAFMKMRRVLRLNQKLVLFLEGGRTFKSMHKLQSQKGKEIGVLKQGGGTLIEKINVPVLPIWIDGADDFFPNTLWVNDEDKGKFPFPRFWKKITVKIGPVRAFPKKCRDDITSELTEILLKLADH